MCILHSPLGRSYVNENTYAPDTGAVKIHCIHSRGWSLQRRKLTFV